MLVQGSRLAIMRADVTAVMCIGAGRRAARLGDARDDGARGAHLGGGEKQVGVDRQREGDGGQRILRRDAGRFERAQIGDERGGKKRQFLGFAGARLVRHRRVDEQTRRRGAPIRAPRRRTSPSRQSPCRSAPTPRRSAPACRADRHSAARSPCRPPRRFKRRQRLQVVTRRLEARTPPAS